MSQLKGTNITVTRKEVPIPGQVEAGTQFTQAWLANHPAGKGKLAIWGCFGDPALGAVSALRQAKRQDVTVYGHDGTPAAIKAVQSGELSGTSFFDPTAEGDRLAEATPTYIKDGVDAKAQNISPTMYLVTPDTVADLLKKFPTAAG
jgi:ABC-type sugar transport system substrate-binding protein